MSPRSIGIVAGGGGPLGSASILQAIIKECQTQHHSCRSYEFPCIDFFSFPYSEMLLLNNAYTLPARELSYCIQQLKVIGMDMIVIPCLTLSSYLTFENYGVELIEVGSVMGNHFKKKEINNPLILCTERARQSGYCEKHFRCRYPDREIQNELNCLIEKALLGERVSIAAILQKLPAGPIVSACTVLNAQMQPVDDPRVLFSNNLLTTYVVKRSYSAPYTYSNHYNRLEQVRGELSTSY